MIRLVLIIILFLMSVLCVFKAPVYLLWFIAILVEEFPWILLGVELILIAWGFKAQRFQAAGNYIAVLSFILFLTPVVRGYLVGKNLPKEIFQAFGEPVETGHGVPFSLSRMISGSFDKSEAVLPYQTMVYETKDDIDLTLDFYAARKPGKRPCVIVVHGGSWAAGDSQQLPELNALLANKGYNVASVNYRLAPKYTSPAPIEDVRSAIQFLKEQTHLHIDTTHFVLLGRSAGGQIVLTAAYTIRDMGICGVVSFYAPADMVWGYSQPANPLIMDSRKVMEDYLGGTYNSVPENYVNSSAVDFVTPRSVPTLLIHGKNDVLVFYEHSIRLSKKLEQNNVPHFLVTLPWATHGCDYTLNGPSGQLSVFSIIYFLRYLEKQ